VIAKATPDGAENTAPNKTKEAPAEERDPVDVHIGYRIRKRRLMLRMTQAALASA
jgi:hypothetical protein